MIIQCINCNKKFEVDSSLIPESGRDLQCGSCNKTWFYKNDLHKNLQSIKEVNEKTFIKKSSKLQTIKTNTTEEIKSDKLFQDQITPASMRIDWSINDNLIKKKHNSSLNLRKFLSYIFVIIITFIALIIILDTFKHPLTNIFPNLEFILFNLFETVKDIFLFLKNLLI